MRDPRSELLAEYEPAYDQNVRGITIGDAHPSSRGTDR
jgi:hypothetical protein